MVGGVFMKPASLVILLVAALILPQHAFANDRGEAPPDKRASSPALAKQFCDALHGLPERRRAECCGTKPGSSLAAECTRLLSRSLSDGSATLIAAEGEACAHETAAVLGGCGRVRPVSPPPPPGCRGVGH